jgi:hypothetical protein
LGVYEPEPGRKFIFIYEDGLAVRMLSRREITALLIDVDDDWRVSNQ